MMQMLTVNDCGVFDFMCGIAQKGRVDRSNMVTLLKLLTTGISALANSRPVALNT
jgi:hypothetical protein